MIIIDAAWQQQVFTSRTIGSNAGLGIYLQLKKEGYMLKAMNSVVAEQVASEVQAEVHGLKLATLIMEKLQIRDTVILTHNITLAQDHPRSSLATGKLELSYVTSVQ